MKITIEISDHYAQVLGKWASISRTLDTAQGACNDLADYLEISNDEDDKRTLEKVKWCSKEIDIIRPAISHLHMQAQNQIWIEQLNPKPIDD